MLGRWSSRSGKRKASPVPPHPGPDADGVNRIIPKHLWSGPLGEFLREVGASPDDPSNLLTTQEQVQARFDKLRKDQDAFVDSINKELPDGAKVIPWAIIPWSLWRQQHAGFLLVGCELYPVGPWNMMLLPEDERGAFILNLPKHLGGIPPGLEDRANEVIGEIHERFSKAHERTGAAMARGETSALDEYGQAKDEALRSMMGLARFAGAQTYGDEAFARHEELFGASLGWNTAG